MSLPTDSALIQSKTFFHRPDLADEVFSEGLLFQTLARSNLDCLWLCSSTQSCLSYTYTTSNATRGRFACRGHTSVMSAQFPSVFAPGARTFVSTTDVQQGAGGCKASIQQCTVIRATGIQQSTAIGTTGIQQCIVIGTEGMRHCTVSGMAGKRQGSGGGAETIQAYSRVQMGVVE